MNYEFSVYQMEVEGHIFWAAESKALTGCVGQGESAEEAINELSDNESDWLKTAKELGIPIPPKTARKEKQYSGKVALRFSPFVHEEAHDNAKELGISLNQYINDAIVTYNTACKIHFNKLLSPSDLMPGADTTLIDFSDRRKNKS